MKRLVWFGVYSFLSFSIRIYSLFISLFILLNCVHHPGISHLCGEKDQVWLSLWQDGLNARFIGVFIIGDIMSIMGHGLDLKADKMLYINHESNFKPSPVPSNSSVSMMTRKWLGNLL